MKRIRTLFLLVALLWCGIAQATITATIDGLKYSLDETAYEATLVSNSYSGDIVIPSSVTYSGTVYKVTSIGDRCFSNRGSLTSVEIPSSVTTLGYLCFSYCTRLSSVVIPSSVITLGDYCFSYCSSLTSVELGSSVISLGNYCFYDCTSLTSVEIPSLVTSLGDYCFYGCTGLTSVGGGASVTSLGDYCFYGCALTSIKIPIPVMSLGDYCFGECGKLTSVEISSSVQSLGWTCFYGCDKLTNVNVDEANPSYASADGVLCDKNLTELIVYPRAKAGAYAIPSSVSCLEEYSFSNCSSLTSIEIPSSVTTLGSHCFWGCSKLTSVKIPSSVILLPNLCFNNCSSLTSVEISSSVSSIGDYCFTGSSSLTNVTFEGTPSIGSGVFSSCSKLTNVNIPIGSYNNFIGKGIDNYLKETVLTLDGQGFSTICSISDLNFEGTSVTAYAASVNDEKTSVTLNEVKQAAAGEGLVVNAPAGTYVIPTTSGLALMEDNALTGVKSTDTQPEISATDNCYALRSYDDGTVAFAKIVSDLTFPYGKAYLKLSDTLGTQQLSVNFGSATGITEISMDETEGAYYTISGTRVGKPTKGLYIRNGKKVYVK